MRRVELRAPNQAPIEVFVWDAEPDFAYMRDLEARLEVRAYGAASDARARAQVILGAARGGVFTTVRIERGALLGWYRGRVLQTPQQLAAASVKARERSGSAMGGTQKVRAADPKEPPEDEIIAPYAVTIPLRGEAFTVDARLGVLSNWTSLVADTADARLPANVEIVECGGIRALRTIEPGEELVAAWLQPRSESSPAAASSLADARARLPRIGAVAGFCAGCSGVAPLGASLCTDPPTVSSGRRRRVDATFPVASHTS